MNDSNREIRERLGEALAEMDALSALLEAKT